MGRDDEIRAIAHAIWEAEGCCQGYDFDHWLRAEVIWEEQQKAPSPVIEKPEATEPPAGRQPAAVKSPPKRPVHRRQSKKG